MNPIVNFILVLFKNITPLLRKEPLKSYTEIFSRGMNMLNLQFVYLISHTGQVASMEHYLNDQYSLTYNIGSRTSNIASSSIIWIGDGNTIVPTYLYNKVEMKPPLYLYNKAEAAPPVYLNNKAEIVNYEFTVYVPASLTYSEAQLRAHIAKYKIAGKRYIIQTY